MRSLSDLDVEPNVHARCTVVHVPLASHPPGSLVESSRAAPFVEDRENVNAVIADHEIHPIGESANARATHSIIMGSVEDWLSPNSLEAGFKRDEELVPEPATSRLVPAEGFRHVELGTESKGKSHRFRCRMRSRTSSQGIPPSGSAFASARRRSRSSRCSGVGGRASSSSGMLSQISSTSSSFSAVDSRRISFRSMLDVMSGSLPPLSGCSKIDPDVHVL